MTNSFNQVKFKPAFCDSLSSPPAPLPFSPVYQGSVLHYVCVLSCAAKFHCQRKSSLTRLQQTRYDSVQGRPNRAPIQLPATGSLLLAQSPLTVRLWKARKEGRTLKEHFSCTCLSNVGCELLLPRLSARTQEGQCPQGEPRGSSPIWSVKFHEVCNDYCSSPMEGLLPGDSQVLLKSRWGKHMFAFLPRVRWDRKAAGWLSW